MNVKPYQDLYTWDSIAELVNNKYKDHKKLSLEPYESVVVVFRGEPYCYESVWQDPDWVLYDPDYSPHQNINPALRILINVTVLDEDILLNKYFDMDVTTFKEINTLRERYGVDNWSYKIERICEDDIEVCYAISLEAKIEDTLKNKISCLPIICLSSIFSKKNDTNFDTIK